MAELTGVGVVPIEDRFSAYADQTNTGLTYKKVGKELSAEAIYRFQ